MNTIADYISQKDEVARLNKQLDMIAGFYISMYSSEIRKLKSELKKKSKDLAVSSKSAMAALIKNRAYQKRLGITYKPIRKDRAIAMLTSMGDTGLTLKQIAEKSGLTLHRINVLSKKMNDKNAK